MQLEIKLFASLQKFMPEQERIEWEDGCTISDLLVRIGISPSEVAIVLVNGRHAQLDQTLHGGDTVAIFPPIAGG